MYKFNKETDINKRLSNPIFYIHSDEVPNINLGKINFSLLLNLVNACNTDNKDVIWGYIKNLNEDIDNNTLDYFNSMIGYAINYFQDFIKPKKKYKTPNDAEIKLLEQLLEALKTVNNDAEEIQNAVYKISKENDIPLKQWFQLLYEILLGTKEGPRMGTFIKLYGLKEVKKLIAEKID